MADADVEIHQWQRCPLPFLRFAIKLVLPSVGVGLLKKPLIPFHPASHVKRAQINDNSFIRLPWAAAILQPLKQYGGAPITLFLQR
ncbi:hypothetical protein ELI13_38050 [Rhizobium ruizarguesonis]|uniref:hypothetical protein n=1 Tax=Rhizobium ruizarguesonis TaxID=2081791 RepID=UPI0010323AD2|nr:hypothetical protein [Rhizobium ruizarguesonis]TAU59248.1 hypothetical protein ELI46_38360 [Rhizobium ruizarguesonis]TAU59300.1 hypothetical protein ELI46_38185 [Rhizobium ruizarguesonis]TAU60934.1 hypothetical protein ELI46_34680 [Rhizobium ruizarguesonis]TAW47870.1 hypothetical protein ELI15_38105 [Rhizobium ruizarguesonis]TAW80971.1 hypothetical protein ELI13_38050 [Rhizobium ruizarguesonis]